MELMTPGHDQAIVWQSGTFGVLTRTKYTLNALNGMRSGGLFEAAIHSLFCFFGEPNLRKIAGKLASCLWWMLWSSLGLRGRL